MNLFDGDNLITTKRKILIFIEVQLLPKKGFKDF